MVGTGIGAKQGILIKGGEALETAHKLKYVIFDKTGTITKGHPEVTNLVTAKSITEQKLLEIAGSIEKSSEHPLAEAIVNKAKEKKISWKKITNFKALTGRGVKAKLGTQEYHLGNLRLMQELKVNLTAFKNEIPTLESEGKTVMILAQGRTVLGIIAVADEIKEDSPLAIQKLQKLGVKVYMITGDNNLTARA